MILRLPFFDDTVGTTTIEPMGDGVFEAGQKIGRLLIDAAPAYELVCQESAQVTFNPGLGSTAPLRPGGNIGAVRSLEAVCDIDLLTLWMASHAAFRGWQSQTGEGGHVANQVLAIEADVADSCGIESLIAALGECDFSNGDILVIADKSVSFAYGRVFPRHFLAGLDPKFLAMEQRREFAAKLQGLLGFSVSERHLLSIDFVGSDRASISVDAHNNVCAIIADTIRRQQGKTIDVVISDSDTGVDFGFPLVGAATVGASPLGATAGLSPYEAMRVCAAAEILRGHAKGIPFVLCKTNPRNARRAHAGEARSYGGTFDLTREAFIHHGLKNTCYWKST